MVAAIKGAADLTALGHKKGLDLQPKHFLNFIVFVTTAAEKKLVSAMHTPTLSKQGSIYAIKLLLHHLIIPTPSKFHSTTDYNHF